MVDWGAIKGRAVAGESMASISRDYPVSRQAIALRADKEKWFEDAEVEPQLSEAWWLIQAEKTELAGKWDPAHPSSFRSDIFAAFLADLSRGNSQATARELHGITKQQLKYWRRDLGVDSLVRAAIARSRKSLVEKIAKAGNVDWRANAWLLERLPDHREEFAADVAQNVRNQGIVVNISVSRDENIALEGGVKMIDVTPGEDHDER